MGAYLYLQELWRKKQSDVMRFLLRVRCWEFRQLPVCVRAAHPTRPDKARRLGYKAKEGYVIYRVRVRRGGRRRQAHLVCRKPKNQVCESCSQSTRVFGRSFCSISLAPSMPAAFVLLLRSVLAAIWAIFVC